MTEESAVDHETTVLTCPDCGEETVSGDRFCENCGNDLLLVTAGTPGDGVAPEPSGCVECGGTDIDADGFCATCGFAQPALRDRVESDLGSVAGVSDRGLRHHRNEDAMALRATTSVGGDTDHVVAVVCDGVSTSDRPDDASKAAADVAADLLLAAARADRDLGPATAQAVHAAQDAVVELAGPGLRNAPACTIVATVVTGDAVTVGWVGDSRAYWLSVDSARQLTVDDSWAQRMIEAGQLSELDAMADPRSHALIAWLGADAGEVVPHVRTVRPTGPGVVLVCSDGLWNYLPDAASLADAALPKAIDAPFGVAAELTAFAIDRGGHDNITVVVVPFPLSSSTKGTDS